MDWHEHDVLTILNQRLHGLDTIHVDEKLLDASPHDSAEVPEQAFDVELLETCSHLAQVFVKGSLVVDYSLSPELRVVLIYVDFLLFKRQHA